MTRENSNPALKDIEVKMDALRSALFQFAEEQAPAAPLESPDPLHDSIITILDAMKTFVSIATDRDK